MSENIIRESINNLLNCKLEELVKDELYVEVKIAFSQKFREFIISEEIKTMCYNFAEAKLLEIEKEDKTIKETLPKGFENSLKVLVYNKGPEITSAIKGFLNDEKFKTKVKIEIEMMVAGLNPMVSKFVNANTIYNKIMASMLSYVDSSENMMSIVMLLNNKIDEGANKNISEVLNYIPYEGKKSFVRAFVDMILTNVTNEIFIKKLEEKFEAEILRYETLGELIKLS